MPPPLNERPFSNENPPPSSQESVLIRNFNQNEFFGHSFSSTGKGKVVSLGVEKQKVFSSFFHLYFIFSQHWNIFNMLSSIFMPKFIFISTKTSQCEFGSKTKLPFGCNLRAISSHQESEIKRSGNWPFAVPIRIWHLRKFCFYPSSHWEQKVPGYCKPIRTLHYWNETEVN